ncbi:molybdopterin-guanine dinucleotide biosynthesis protein B [Niallia sp. 01092]|uniref:molybdopterin-guanine dinucleotide biosynthesis protein B n=1 Tax=unclassified Niallia TaxID=2837522 RepID=UPI003FD50FD5
MIVQFVGYQNSGKTTAMEWTIQALTEKGIRVVALKHHGHGGTPSSYLKDSTKHRKAGALASVVEGEGILQLEMAKQEWSFEKVQQLLSFLDYDVLLVEGYKKERFPKVVFLRSEEEKKEFASLANIQYIVPYCETLDEKQGYLHKIVQWIEDEINKNN